ncbi:7-keto-8-aminopelargonate synthetase-like enzyme [Rhizobium sp. BK650]|uniref:8-amino-7-oxononanoate synthase family protein n=1 Tax=Rhizobium sp. BK650 TaxID=2586990 RepID=UPI0017B725B5|nr:aminotransferase class I/II-fold pyridoxal phosphate-dependent enzyme [Rhizobium sp. BK650]MBB3660990.1 7-keto-8-aminopelargonate synthetase-like enzyme [Rhizobium sp. BK650]
MKTRNFFRNNAKMIAAGDEFWAEADKHGLAGIVGRLENGRIHTSEGHSFVNFSCCSYLDLDQHPKILEGAISAIRRFGTLNHCITRARVQIPAMGELEDALSYLLQAQVVTAISANVASSGVLPLIASGHLSGGKRPLMVFDKNCHVSLMHQKPICADETEVETCAYHDLDLLEDRCKTNESVCYICDGADSLGGYAPVAELSYLQQKYGLHVYYDDSHSLSAFGPRGVGYVRSNISELDERTMIVVSLHKAFGTSGGALMMGKRKPEELKTIFRYAGAIGYSQPMNTAAIGASLASVEIHATPELTVLQDQLMSNIRLFDELVPTEQSGFSFPIRFVRVPEADVIRLSVELFKSGYYVSPIFFPVVAKGKAGLRVMMRAGQTHEQISELARMINEITLRSAA